MALGAPWLHHPSNLLPPVAPGRDDTFTLKLCLYETPFYTTMVFRFNGEQLLLDSENNVAFGPTTLPQLVGEPATGPVKAASILS